MVILLQVACLKRSYTLRQLFSVLAFSVTMLPSEFIGPDMRLLRAIQLLAILLFLQSCATISSNPADLIMGTWQSTVGGFSVTTTYDKTEVAVDGHEALGYRLDENQLMIDGDETTRRLVTFPSSSEMIQVDIITGTEHRFERVSDAG
jgi:hypothetical protein